MSTWIKNLKTGLENKEVIVLHGNVRDKYICFDTGFIYNNLTELLAYLARSLPIAFSQFLYYDPVGQERRSGVVIGHAEPHGSGDLEMTEPAPVSVQKAPPTRILARWERETCTVRENIFAVIFYLDKLISYKTGYQPEERELLLRLEKIIENITPNHRLVMVALQDSMIPVELYTSSPKVAVISLPRPDKSDRTAYLQHSLGESYAHIGLVADLTDGLFLRDLDNVIRLLNSDRNLSARNVRGIVNKYRLGEQEDYWGMLDINKLNLATGWFTNEEGVKGQDEAIKRVIDIMMLARAGLTGMASGTNTKPKGTLFFAGPTGVGKTFLAKKLAKFLFGSEEAFIRFDMSEFKEEHTDSKLIGSPPGYVGYESGGVLTEKVRERPFSVILFDEIEKAHPRILDIFLQVIDEGRLTDSRGQTVFFTETVIIFTSNIGARTTDSRGNPINEKDKIEAILSNTLLGEEERERQISGHFKRAVSDFFLLEISRPELLNRIGNNIIPFNYINSEKIQRDIFLSHFARSKADFEDRFKNQNYRLEFDESVTDYLVSRYSGNISSFGGRAITNAIEDEIMKALSRAVLKAEYLGKCDLDLMVRAVNGSLLVEEKT